MYDVTLSDVQYRMIFYLAHLSEVKPWNEN